jgi:hypothetical protein
MKRNSFCFVRLRSMLCECLESQVIPNGSIFWVLGNLPLFSFKYLDTKTTLGPT